MKLFSLIREDRLFSTIYITGTAMAITFTMIMAIVYYIKLADIYPEVNRSHTVYLTGVTTSVSNGKQGGAIYMDYSYSLYQDYCQKIQNVLYMAPSTLSSGNGKSLKESARRVLSFDGSWKSATTNFTNQDFFKIYEFEFLSGKPFTEDEVSTEVKTAVITRDFADVIFGKDVDPVGERFTMRACGDYTVCGVVKSASQLTPDSYAQVYVPYTTSKVGDDHNITFSSIIVMLKDNEQLELFRTELNEMCHAMSDKESPFMKETGIGDFTFHLGGDEEMTYELSMSRNLETHASHMLMADQNSDGQERTLNDRILYFLGVLAVLLFVPAINLCGMVAGRMEKRLPEMGVRKSFGAKRSTLLLQVLKENMSFTFVGGAIGLVISWASLVLFRNNILGLFFDSSLLKDSTYVSGEAMFAPSVFIFAFVSITILNIASAMLPAYLSLRKPIVESMNDKQ